MAKILIVGDNSYNNALLSACIEEDGHDEVLATSGQQALELIGQEAPATILLNVRMSEIDGLEVCRILKQHSEWQHIPVIKLTRPSTLFNKPSRSSIFL